MQNSRPFINLPTLIFLFSVHPTLSQHLNFKQFTTQDGLPSQMVYEAFQDSKGFMWFATSSGVSRFDGYRFHNYSVDDGLPDNEIFGFYEDVFNRIWFRSMNGKIGYYRNGKIYSSQNTPALKDLDNPSIIWKINGTRDSAVLITYFNHGVVKYTSKNEAIKFNLSEHKGTFQGAYENPDNTYTVFSNTEIYVLNPGGEIIANHKFDCLGARNQLINGEYYSSCRKDKDLTKLNKTYGSAILFQTENTILNICKAKEKDLWICTKKGAILSDTEGKRTAKIYLEDNQISSVAEDKENNLWFTTLDNGVFLLTKDDVKNFTVAEGLSSNKIYTINKDDLGNIWIGHDNYVLSKIDIASGKVVQHKITETVPDRLKTNIPSIHKIEIDKSGTMIFANPAFFYLQNKHVQVVSFLKGRDGVKWYDDTYIVASGNNGLRAFSKNLGGNSGEHHAKTKVVFHSDSFALEHLNTRVLSKLRANCVYREKEGKVWIGLDKGLVCLTKDTSINFHKIYPILEERVLDIKQDSSGTLYLATSSKGVIILKKNGAIGRISKKEGLSSNQCNKIAIDKNTLWIATNNGLNRITLNKNSLPVKISTINFSHGLLSDFIVDIIVDDEQAWIGTSHGLSVIDKKGNVSDDPEPTIYVTGVEVNNHPVDTLTKKAFHHEENNLKIEYVGLSFKSKGNIKYQYKLGRSIDSSKKEQGKWQETSNTSIDFSSLQPGDYTFSVMAQSARGTWSQPVRYNFVINTPFWWTKGFIILSTFTLTVVAVSLWRYAQKVRERKKRDKRNLQMAELKSLRSQTNYHFMSNAFNSLQGLFFSDNGGVDQYIGKFSKLMRFTMEYADRQQILLSEELAYVKLYCDIEQLRVGDKFLLNIEFFEGLDQMELLVPALSLQPFIENAIWHGIMPQEHSGKINLRVLPHDTDSYKILIDDNGVGINHSLRNKAKTNRKSYGTKLIINRFEVIKSQYKNKFNVSIEDLADVNQTNGTRITITLPYQYDE